MLDAINNFQQQFSYRPEIKNKEAFKDFDSILCVGMGGSHLAADLLPILDIYNVKVWKNYDLPNFREKENPLILLSSYSGNTEEVLSAYEEAVKQKRNLFVICTGGTLLEWAIRDNIAYIELPSIGIQPRSALGYSLIALLTVLGKNNFIEELVEGARGFDSKNIISEARVLASKLENKIPLIYASEENTALAYNWKIKFNENSKIPAFCNTFPELNHNEMNGFARDVSTQNLSNNMFCIILKSPSDHPRTQKRMDILNELYKESGLACEIYDLQEKTLFEKIFSSLLLADYVSVFLADYYGIDPESVPLVEGFKAKLA